MVRASWESCTCGDDNLCTTADAFIHSEVLVYCPVLRHRLPPKSRASVHSHKYVHTARTGLPLKPRRIFTRPKNVHGAPEGGCLNERRDRRSHAAANRGVSSGTAFGTSHGVIVTARLSVASLSAERRGHEQILVRSFSLRPILSSTT